MKKEIKQILTSRVWLAAIAFFLFAMPSAPTVKSQAENQEPWLNSLFSIEQPPRQEAAKMMLGFRSDLNLHLPLKSAR